jgi:ferric-dicitrate binding protein FerR (iron transport regulator)
MIEPEELSDSWKELIDDYLDGLLDEAGMQELENHLRADGSARDYFVRYARLHTDLCLEARAQEAASRALERLEQLTASNEDRGSKASGVSNDPGTGASSRPARLRRLYSAFPTRRLAIAAGLLIAVVAGGFLARTWVGHGRADEELAVAWLVNAQDCTWSDPGLTGNLQAGATLKIERGLAEFQFQCGARIILEGPSEVQLLSSRSARLVSGKLTARVPAEAVGFEVLSPHGKVVDLGTEFGVRSNNGVTEIYVFKGQVEALASGVSNDPGTGALTRPARLLEHQAAQMTSGTIRPIEPTAADSQFVRTIVAPPVIVPRTLQLSFKQSIEATIRDRDGVGIGLRHRLPGTGKNLAERDGNLHLNQDKSQLELTTTNSDLNTQYQLDRGEYFGVRLADLGFTGKEDFAVAVTIHNIPALDVVGQFGLYAGARSDRSIRGGLIGHMEAGQYTQFLVNNDKGIDTADICKVGLLSTGTDLRLTFKRTGGKYSLTVENLTEGSTSTLTIRHPDFLDEEKDLYVGLFGANTQSEVRKTLVFKDFQATVWTEKK